MGNSFPYAGSYLNDQISYESMFGIAFAWMRGKQPINEMMIQIAMTGMNQNAEQCSMTLTFAKPGAPRSDAFVSR